MGETRLWLSATDIHHAATGKNNLSQNFSGYVSNDNRPNFILFYCCGFATISVNIDGVFVCFFHHFNWLIYINVIPAWTSVYMITSACYFFLQRMHCWYNFQKVKTQQTIFLLPDKSSTTVGGIYWKV